ncbi:MAG: hypothetical protein ABL860_03500 [Candidatus Nitrotoga sp.]
MSKDDIAIVVSLASICLAAIALGWNIYRDIVLKPRLRVSVFKGTLTSGAIKATDQFIISAVNFGPGKLHLNSIRFMHTSLLKKMFQNWKHGVLIHDYQNPLSGKLPAILDVGEKIDFLFSWSAETLCSKAPSHIGIADSFGRTHWAPRKNVIAVNKQWLSEFSSVTR